MGDSPEQSGNDSTDQWPGLPPELLLRNWRNLPPILKRLGVVLREVEPGAELKLADNLQLCTAKTPHTAESMAVRVNGTRSIGYTGDTAPSDDLVELFGIFSLRLRSEFDRPPADFAIASSIPSARCTPMEGESAVLEVRAMPFPNFCSAN